MKLIQEYVSLSDQNPFLVSIFNEPDLSYPFHHHKYAFELTLTLGLTGTRMVGDNTEQFFDRDLVLMAPGLPHCWQDHGVRNNSKHKVVVVQFSDKLVPKETRVTRHFKEISNALEQANYGLELKEAYKEKVIRLILQLTEEDSFENYNLLLNVLRVFGNEKAVRKLCGEGYSQPSLKDEAGRLEKVLQYIQENYSEKIMIEDLAELAHMSPSAFSHYFKKRTLKSFTDFVMDLRLGKAAQLLQLEEMPITSVSFKSGFSNISHFNRSFSKKYKTTPLKFRKQALQTHLKIK
jgi:AraC-like DNA-binding protein